MSRQPQVEPLLSISRWVVQCGLCILAGAGCEHVGYRMARDAASEARYVEASEAARVAVEDDPDSTEYKRLRDECEQKAAERLVEQAQKHMTSGDLSRADYAARRAVSYSPQNDAAKKIQGRIYELRQQALEQLSNAERLLAEGEPDQAVLLLERLQPKAVTYPQIKQAYQRALLAGYGLHLKNGVNLFENFDYEGACKEFEVALGHVPARKDGQAWMRNAQAHLRAQRLCERGENAFAKRFFQEAHKRFSEALAEVPGFALARKGLKRALSGWADEVYARARELEGEAVKPALCDSLEAYTECEGLIPDFKDVRARIQGVHHRLAEIYFEEAEYFIRQPDLRTIGLAHYCLTKSQQHDPGLRTLSTLLPQVKRLFDIYRRVAVRIDIQGEGQYPGVLAQALGREIAEANFPDVSVELGRTAGLHAEYDREVSAAAASLGLETAALGVPYSVLQVGGTVRRNFAEKTGGDKPILITSSYTSHTEQVPNPEYTDAGARLAHWREVLAAAGAEAEGLATDVTRASREYERRRREHADAASGLGAVRLEQEKLRSTARGWADAAARASQQAQHLDQLTSSATEAANGYLAQAEQYDQNAQNAAAPEQADFYRKQAADCRAKANDKQEQARQYRAQAEAERDSGRRASTSAARFTVRADAMNPEVRQLDRQESEASDMLKAATYRSNTARSALDNCRTRRTAAQFSTNKWAAQINSLPPRKDVNIATSYNFSQYQLQVFGCLRADLHILAEHGTVVEARPAVNVTERATQLVNKGVQSTDINGYENNDDALPSAAALQEQLQAEATRKLAKQIREFFGSYHQKRFYNVGRKLAGEKQQIPAANAYACFLACEDQGTMAAEARGYLAKLSRKQLR